MTEMNEMFAQFNDMFGDLSEEINEVTNGQVEKKVLPFDDYEVKLIGLKIDEHRFDDDYKGYPELQIVFKVINDEEYNGQKFYINKKLMSIVPDMADRRRKTAFLMVKALEFVNSLEGSFQVAFENMEQLVEDINTLAEELKDKAEYQLHYFENKGFRDYQIVKRFE